MMQTAGASLIAIEPGTCTIEAPISQHLTQQHGFGHAGLTFALGDSAAGYAALAMMEPDQEVLTSEMKINLLSPAKGDTLRADGRVIRAGKRLVVVQADVFAISASGEMLIAILQGTMVPV
ncbi:PaaI family thioesterase [Litoreibacter sp.]|nr:PaaI family thioesterase [Litoreibacter sp.]